MAFHSHANDHDKRLHHVVSNSDFSSQVWIFFKIISIECGIEHHSAMSLVSCSSWSPAIQDGICVSTESTSRAIEGPSSPLLPN